MVKINPADSAIIQNPYQISRAEEVQTAPLTAPNSDTIKISDEAQQRLRGEMSNVEIREGHRQAEGSGSSWELASGLKEGTFTLKNGNIQKVSINDGTLTIEEFRNGKLVKSVTGTITDTGAVLDTEFYDSNGKVIQSIHTEVAETETREGWTASTMTRDIKWYDGDQLKGEMHDNMLLRTKNVSSERDEDTAAFIKLMVSKGTAAVDTNVDNVVKMLTVEKQALDYNAEIKEYGEGSNLLREILVEQSGDYKQLSNRNMQKVAGMEGRTTRELDRETGLDIQVRDYDSDGELVREARLSDSQRDHFNTDDRKQHQSVDVSWFNKGELVKRSHGSMTLDETNSLRLPDRPGFLEVLGMKDEEYLGQEPQSAMDLMTTKLMSNASEADMFMDGIAKHINGSDYSAADGIAMYGERERPYSISWTDEIYRDGEMIMRQKDTEGAQASSFWQKERGILFKTGAGLTENANPVVLKESSHEREVFENGRAVSHQSMDVREIVDVKMDGPDALRTISKFQQGLDGNVDTTVIDGAGGVDGVDSEANAAARGFANELELTLDAMRVTLASLNKGEADDALDYRVRFNFMRGLVD